ncbi:MAG: DUF6472 family protein [Clostridiales bacterium]|nr:DUF6472 family protein [Clostridiales bacterium]
MGSISCEFCMNYQYDEEYECYSCVIDMDEDEYLRFLSMPNKGCPYYRQGDDYTIVRRQL